jgi:hypothetical protein
MQGYRVMGRFLRPALRFPDAPRGSESLVITGQGIRYEAMAGILFPLNRAEAAYTAGPPALVAFRDRIKELPDGRYRLSIDGSPVDEERPRDLWKEHLSYSISPDYQQVERLRQAIIAKNRLYFYRWRPQNETYLFGFRKHEQGNNAAEIPLFDPLVEEKEQEIARLKVPVKHVYELIRVEGQ